jgi:hypothetical protein
VKKDVVNPLDYQTALEKAVLEYAASVKSLPPGSTNGHTRIPGFMDNHVWAMASTLGEQGMLVVKEAEDKKGLGITEIKEAGSDRLREIRAAEEREAEASRAKAAATNGASRKRKWWKLGMK